MEVLKKNAISEYELAVLTMLHDRIASEGSSNTSVKTIEISEISHSTGINDNDEVLRALYTLEGKSFVTPEPPGSFTSTSWKITDIGCKALQLVRQ